MFLGCEARESERSDDDDNDNQIVIFPNAKQCAQVFGAHAMQCLDDGCEWICEGRARVDSAESSDYGSPRSERGRTGCQLADSRFCNTGGSEEIGGWVSSAENTPTEADGGGFVSASNAKPRCHSVTSAPFSKPATHSAQRRFHSTDDSSQRLLNWREQRRRLFGDWGQSGKTSSAAMALATPLRNCSRNGSRNLLNGDSIAGIGDEPLQRNRPTFGMGSKTPNSFGTPIVAFSAPGQFRDAMNEHARRIQQFWRKSKSGPLDSSKRNSSLKTSSIDASSVTKKLKLVSESWEFGKTSDDPNAPQGLTLAAKKIQAMWRQKSRGTLDNMGDVPRIRSNGASGHRPGQTTPTNNSDSCVLHPCTKKAQLPTISNTIWARTKNWFWGTLPDSGGGQGLLEAWWQDNKKRALQSLLHNSAPILKRTLGDLGDLLKENAAADPDMPRWLKSAATTVISSFWEDVELEIEAGLKRAAFTRPENEETEPNRRKPKLGRLCVVIRGTALRFRAFFLSHYLPHDRSIFGKLKDPLYLIMVASTMLPLFGIRVFFFGVVLTMLLYPGPPDEYQLINFILIFKGTQFFTTGVVLGYLGALEFYACYLLAGDEFRNCVDERGPGATDWLSSLCFDIVGSVVLVWIACLGLPMSKSHWHSRVSLHGQPPSQQEDVYCCCLRGVVGRGGRIRWLLRYDLCCFIGCTVFFTPIYFASEYHAFSQADSRQKVIHAKSTIFWCRILYSLLSLPFVVFVVPGLGRVLTHSVQTGYNSSGVCLEFFYAKRFRDKHI